MSTFLAALASICGVPVSWLSAHSTLGAAVSSSSVTANSLFVEVNVNVPSEQPSSMVGAIADRVRARVSADMQGVESELGSPIIGAVDVQPIELEPGPGSPEEPTPVEPGPVTPGPKQAASVGASGGGSGGTDGGGDGGGGGAPKTNDKSENRLAESTGSNVPLIAGVCAGVALALCAGTVAVKRARGAKGPVLVEHGGSSRGGGGGARGGDARGGDARSGARPSRRSSHRT
ncbi:hypothetical protein KFE25_000817 [Diacronema lutheri]|uniref:Uncharacterized protein n=1 Tax=Diacronema lutheri TaxID=2081491 RepID=A0A8J5XET8_DIALT|nr:hypothetical protein KFE25_000817 [Diacronema lutheri]